MLIAVAVYAMTIPAGAACGKVYAHMMDWPNEDTHAAMAAVFPPYGAFCALNILTKG